MLLSKRNSRNVRMLAILAQLIIDNTSIVYSFIQTFNELNIQHRYQDNEFKHSLKKDT